MPAISQSKVEDAIRTTCSTVLRNEHYFADLDGLAGANLVHGSTRRAPQRGVRVVEI